MAKKDKKDKKNLKKYNTKQTTNVIVKIDQSKKVASQPRQQKVNPLKGAPPFNTYPQSLPGIVHRQDAPIIEKRSDGSTENLLRIGAGIEGIGGMLSNNYNRLLTLAMSQNDALAARGAQAPGLNIPPTFQSSSYQQSAALAPAVSENMGKVINEAVMDDPTTMQTYENNIFRESSEMRGPRLPTTTYPIIEEVENIEEEPPKVETEVDRDFAQDLAEENRKQANQEVIEENIGPAIVNIIPAKRTIDDFAKQIIREAYNTKYKGKKGSGVSEFGGGWAALLKDEEISGRWILPRGQPKWL